jgi:outer membrane protein TolC
MRLKFTAFLTGFVLFAAAPAHADRAVTFDDAIKLAKENNKDLKSARERIAQARAQVEQVRAALLPVLGVQGKYTRNSNEARLDLAAQSAAVNAGFRGVGAIFQDPNLPASTQAAGRGLVAQIDQAERELAMQPPIVIQPFNQLDFNASLNVPLVVPWAYDAQNAAKKNVLVSKATYGATEVALLNGAATTFYAAAGSEELVQARKNAIQVAQKTLDNAKVKLQAGVVNRVEVTRAEIALVRAQQLLRESEDQRANAYASLATVIQLREPFHVEVAQPGPPPVEVPLEEVARTAASLRPEAVAYQRGIEASQLQERSNLLRWAPTLSGFGLFRAFNYAGFFGQNYVWSLGLQLDWAIYDGGVRDANRKIAASQYAESSLKLSQLRDTISDELATARRATITKRKALEAAQRAVVLARETLDLVRVQHDAGTATQLDLLTAQDQLVNAEVAVAQARFEVALADISFKRAAGVFPGPPETQHQ